MKANTIITQNVNLFQLTFSNETLRNQPLQGREMLEFADCNSLKLNDIIIKNNSEGDSLGAGENFKKRSLAQDVEAGG